MTFVDHNKLDKYQTTPQVSDKLIKWIATNDDDFGELAD
jgi:hypothetical protein